MHLLLFVIMALVASPCAAASVVRRRVERDPVKAAACLKRLPAVSLQEKGALIQYSKCSSTNVSPKWAEAKPLVPTLHSILDLTGGSNLLLVSMKNGVMQFLNDNPAIRKQTQKEIETTAYSLTTLISQMQNHKKNSTMHS